jgi:amino acid transporter
MNFIATLLNLLLFIFTFFLIVSNGVSGQGAYIMFSLLLLMVPVLNFVLIFPHTKNHNWFSFHIRRRTNELLNDPDDNPMDKFLIAVVITLNVVLFGFTCWAFVDQYVHPRDGGVMLHTILVFVTPMISLVTIIRNLAGIGHSVAS